MAERAPHILWLTEYHPTLELESYWRLSSDDEAVCALARRLWESAFHNAGNRFLVAQNARWSIPSEVEAVERMYREGIQRDRNKAGWYVGLGEFLECMAVGMPEEKRAARLADVLMETFFVLDSAAAKLDLVFRIKACLRAAVDGDKFRLLSTADAEERRLRPARDDEESARHVAAIIGGLLSLVRDNLPSAVTHLERAELTSRQRLAPCLSLANELLRLGKVGPVSKYLSSCAAHMNETQPVVAIWLAELASGETPSLAW